MVGGRQQSTGSWWPDFSSIGSARKLDNSQDVDNLQLNSLYITVDQRLARFISWQLVQFQKSTIWVAGTNEWIYPTWSYEQDSNKPSSTTVGQGNKIIKKKLKHLSPTTTQTTQATKPEWVASQILELRHRSYSTLLRKAEAKKKKKKWWLVDQNSVSFTRVMSTQWINSAWTTATTLNASLLRGSCKPITKNILPT